jgi:tRNA(Ile2) C34 agmatinyltransferase TiaS
MPADEQENEVIYATKRCPECSTYVSLDVKKCPKCSTRLGEIEKHGTAKRTVDWTAYIIFLLAFLAFAIYIWWAFF